VAEHFEEKNKTTATELARQLRLPEDIFSRQVLRLSTGERQRLALIRALVAKPAVLLLDEPTSSLDQESVAAVESLLASELERGLVLILVTHDPAQAERLGNQTMHIKDGKVLPA
jgi:ABC-type lipoprotein export system ATPase subunit